MQESRRSAVITAGMSEIPLIIMRFIIQSVNSFYHNGLYFNDYAACLRDRTFPTISIPVTRKKPMRAKRTALPICIFTCGR